MATTASMPSPALTLPTPQAPGFFPETPSPSQYAQTEGPLEAAGRDLTPSRTSAGNALLGAAAGLLAGGIGGAIAGAGLVGLTNLEDDGLRQKGIATPTKGANNTDEDIPVGGVDMDEAPTGDVELGDSAAAREVGGGTVAAAALAGGAGAGLLENEVKEVDSTTADEHSEAAGVVPEEDKQEGLSTGEKVLIGAGAGAAAGGIAGAALEDKEEDFPAPSLSSTHSTPKVASTSTFQPTTTTIDDEPELATADKGKAKAVDGESAALGAVATATEPSVTGTSTADTESIAETTTTENDAVQALAAQLAGLDDLSPNSRFHEELDSPIEPSTRPNLTSKFSDATFASTITEEVESSQDRFADQRAIFNPHRSPHLTSQEERKDIPPIDPASLAAAGANAAYIGQPALVGGGFTMFADQEPTTAQLEFGALSKPSSPPVPYAPVYPNTSAPEVPRTPSKNNNHAAIGLGAGAAAGVVGAGVLTGEEETSRRYSGTPTADSGHRRVPSLTHSPKQHNLAGVANSEASPSQDSLLYPTNYTSPPSISSTRAVRGSPVATAPGTPASVHGSPTMSNGEGFQHDGIIKSPHMKIATRKDSIGHNRLAKESLSRNSTLKRTGAAGASPVSPAIGSDRSASPASGSPNTDHERTAGEDIWNSSVANVVNEETAHRGGHRPALMKIDSEDYHEGSPASPTPAPAFESQAQAPRSRSGSKSEPRKLQKDRRGSISRRSGDFSDKEREGFLSKVFGRGHGHSRSASQSSDHARSPNLA
ncbi:hypothetical protein MNV49_003181 [Pseudohyphozyma bogoriensis]|nr:hypothetical protein MNV49_003181 [Pseudohyphozyma bogoriensis]